MKPYYEEEGITIYHGDCREIIPKLDVVDLIIADPPYGVEYEGGHLNPYRDRLIGDDADVYSWGVPIMLSHCTGPCYIFFSDSRVLPIYQAVDDCGGQVHALIIWHKTNATYAAMGSQYKQRHEPILYCKGKNAKTNWCGPSNESTLWNIRTEGTNTLHPTQKPVAVIKRAIGNHIAEVILDPFMGSGTTLRAAKDLGRKAIGIEIEEKYCEIAVERLRQEVLPF